MRIYYYGLVAGGQVGRREHESETLDQAAVEVFRDLLARLGNHFRVPVPMFEDYELEWTCPMSGAACATFRYRGIPVTTSALLSGYDPAADQQAAQALQDLVLSFHQESSIEPGFDALAISERPVILTHPLPSAIAAGPDFVAIFEVIIDMETYLAAAYFQLLLAD